MISVFFAGWIDQRSADFAKSRSLAIAAAKDALEDAGFALPEPIYRLRFDASAPAALQQSATLRETQAAPVEKQPPQRSRSAETESVAPDKHLEDKVDEERRDDPGSDLLSPSAPVE